MLTAAEFSKGFVFIGDIRPDLPFKIRTATPSDWRPILRRRGLHDLEISPENVAMLEAGFAAYAAYARRMLVGAAPKISDPADLVPPGFSTHQSLMWSVGWACHQKFLGDFLVAITEAALILETVGGDHAAVGAVEFRAGPGRQTWH